MKNLKSLIFLFVILVAIAFFIFKRMQNNDIEKQGKLDNAAKPIQIVAKVLSFDTLNQRTFVTGNLIPWKMTVIQSEIAGRVVVNNIIEGKSYTKGTLLLQLNDDELIAERRKLKAELELWKTKEKRIKQLVDKQAISLEELDEAVAKIAQINADISLVESKISKSKILAPFDGSVGTSDITEGAYLMPGTSITQFFQTSNIKVEFNVPEKYKTEIKLGDVISFNSLSKSFKASVYAIEPLINNQNRTFKVRAKAENLDKLMTPGAYTEVILGNNSQFISYMVPSNAIIFGKPSPTLYKVKNGKAVSQPIEMGIRTEIDIQITKGLEPGDTIIVGGIALLKPNAPVTIDQIIQ